MVESTLAWWTLLRVVAAVNIVAWVAATLWLWWQRERWPPDCWLDRRWQLLLSAGYVFGCAWRCAWPVYDVPRLVMVDSFWSSVIVGRSVATVAELCFAAQWALLLRAMSRAAGSEAGLAVSRIVLPAIALAECFSWHAVLTTSNLGHVVEESLWGTIALLLVASLALAWSRVDRAQRSLLAVGAAAGLGYAAYMFGVDVPMYWQRWAADEAAGRGALSLSQGLVDVASRWTVSHRWEDWRSEVVWMTAYFSAAVWLSIALALTPAWRAARRTEAMSGAPSGRRESSCPPRRTASTGARQ